MTCLFTSGGQSTGASASVLPMNIQGWFPLGLNLPAMPETKVPSLGQEQPWIRERHPTPVLAWKIPWMEEPGRLQSMGSLRVGHNWATSLSLFTFMHWRRKWQPTPVFLPEESQGWGSLVAAVYGVTQSRTRLKWLSIACKLYTLELLQFTIFHKLNFNHCNQCYLSDLFTKVEVYKVDN